jgi:hypothetical protein
MNDKTFSILTVVVCTVVLGVPWSIGGYLVSGWSWMVFIGFAFGAVLGEAIAVGVYGLSKFHEEDRKEQEEIHNQIVSIQKKVEQIIELRKEETKGENNHE